MVRCAISAKSRVINYACVSQHNKTSLKLTNSRWRAVALLSSVDNKISQVFLCCQFSEMLSASPGVLELVCDCMCMCSFTYFC